MNEVSSAVLPEQNSEPAAAQDITGVQPGQHGDQKSAESDAGLSARKPREAGQNGPEGDQRPEAAEHYRPMMSPAPRPGRVAGGGVTVGGSDRRFVYGHVSLFSRSDYGRLLRRSGR